MNSLNQEHTPSNDFRKFYLWFVIALPALWLMGHTIYIYNLDTPVGVDKHISATMSAGAAMILVPFLLAYIVNIIMYFRKHDAPETAIIDNAYIFSLKFTGLSALFSFVTAFAMSFIRNSYLGAAEFSYNSEFILGNLMVTGLYVIVSSIVAYIVAIIYTSIVKLIYILFFKRGRIYADKRKSI